MSETNSAVLDLQDDDEEVAEVVGRTVTAAQPDAGSEIHAPLLMEEGYDIAIKVDNPTKRLSTMETYVTYRVRCVCARWPSPPPYVTRRYNHFKVLHKRLSSSHPLLAIPPLPPHHSALEQLDRYQPSFVALRTLALNAFLDRIAKHPILTHSEEFRTFVTVPDGDVDRVFRGEGTLGSLWGRGNGDPRPPAGYRVKDPEFSSASDYLHSLQQKLATLNTLTSKLCKGTNALGVEMAGLKTASETWSECSPPLHTGVSSVSEAAHRAATARRLSPLPFRATLPFLSAYAAALSDKIGQRNQLHAAHLSGNTSEEIHNRLLQSSESLRSDLADWTPKTRNDLKKLLINIAEKQINIHQQTFTAWEQALKKSTAKTPEELFKTVSKNAVLNYSPSKQMVAKNDDSIKEIDDIDIDSDYQDYSLDVSDNDNKIDSEFDRKLSLNASISTESNNVENGAVKPNIDRNIREFNTEVEIHDFKSKLIDSKVENSLIKNENESFQSANELFESSVSRFDSNSEDQVPNLSSMDARALEDIFENQFFDISSDLSQRDVSANSGSSKLVSSVKEQSLKSKLQSVDAISDPLNDFSDIDLSKS